jgi:hypothetical protein
MTTTAYSYRRFSSKRQEKGTSKDRQEDLAGAWGKRNPEYDLDLSGYQDLGIPVWRGQNKTYGALGAFLSAVEKGVIRKHSILLIESLGCREPNVLHDDMPYCRTTGSSQARDLNRTAARTSAGAQLSVPNACTCV